MAASVSAGAAVWALQTVSASPLDAIATGAAAAYGVTRMGAAYAGPAFQVRRDSDNATQDIGFDANGVADWAAAASFAGATQLYLATWYDQTGNGCHATSDANGNQPPLFLNKIGSRTGLDFTAGKYLMLPAALSLDRRNCTVLSCARPRGAYRSVFWTLGSTAAISGHFNTGNQELWNGTSDLSPLTWHVDQGVRLARFTTTNVTGGIDDRSGTINNPGAALTMTGGYIPRSTGQFEGVYGALIFYATALSDVDIASVRRSLYLSYGLPPQLRDRLVFVGDSISFGLVTSDNQGYAQKLLPSLTRSYSLANLGIPSQLQSAQSASTYTPFVVGGNKSAAFVSSGTNDIAAGASAAALETTTQTLCSGLRSGGFRKVIVATMLPRTGGFTGDQDAAGFETAAAGVQHMAEGQLVLVRGRPRRLRGRCLNGTAGGSE